MLIIDNLKLREEFSCYKTFLLCCSCRPRWLQFFHRPLFLSLAVAFTGFTQNFAVNGLLGAVISTLEKRFHFASKQTALISIMYDIAMVFVLLPVSHFGQKGQKRMLYSELSLNVEGSCFQVTKVVGWLLVLDCLV